MKGKSVIIFAIFVLVFFGLPILSGSVNIPKKFSSKELGDFLGSTLRYWLDLIIHALRKLGFPLSHGYEV